MHSLFLQLKIIEVDTNSLPTSRQVASRTGNVPESIWNFYIGGYQPAHKWLKDRKGHTLTNSDIEHYQKIIVALSETIRIMSEIDKIKIQ